MDGYALILIAVGILLYLINRRKSQGWKQLGILVGGIGFGLLIGAVWSSVIIANALSIFPMP
jgi:hypothetical protein